MDLEDMDIVDGTESNGNEAGSESMRKRPSPEFVVYDHANGNRNRGEIPAVDEDETTDILIPPISRRRESGPSAPTSEVNESHHDSRKIWDFVKRTFKYRGSDFGLPLASCNPLDFEYNMNHPLRGKAIIFNHTTFEPTLKLSDRPGSDKDASDLRDCLERLNFKVEIHNNLRRIKIHSILEKESLENHNDEDCFIVVVMSHGQNLNLHSYDDIYTPEELWLPFTANKCGSLAGKPKMFFIQACRGDKYDHGTVLMKPKTRTEVDGPGNTKAYKIPNHADFLIVFSTVPASANEPTTNEIENRTLLSRLLEYMSLSNLGHFSWRSSLTGGCFIQALCRVFDQYAWDLDVLSMITIVNREVAINYESNVPRDVTQHQKKQVPQVNHTLTRQIRLSPKPGASTLV